MTGREGLTDAERKALVDWWDSDWPDDVDGVLGTLWDVVAGIVAGRVRGLAHELLTLREIDGRPDWRAGPEECAAWLRGCAESPGHTEAGSGSQGARGAVEGAEWACLHCGDSHETHEGDCCCHGRDEDSE